MTQCASSPFVVFFFREKMDSKIGPHPKNKDRKFNDDATRAIVELIIHDKQKLLTSAQSTQTNVQADRLAGNQARQQGSNWQAGMNHKLTRSPTTKRLLTPTDPTYHSTHWPTQRHDYSPPQNTCLRKRLTTSKASVCCGKGMVMER